MGTRSTTRVVCGDVTLVVMYRQFDGHISGHVGGDPNTPIFDGTLAEFTAYVADPDEDD